MPINLQKIAANTSTITVTSGEDSAKIKYSPELVTEETFAQLLQLYSMQAIVERVADEGDLKEFKAAFQSLNQMIVHLVRSWEIYATDEDEKAGNPFPLDGDLLPKLSLRIRLSIIYGIMADMRPESMALQETKETK